MGSSREPAVPAYSRRSGCPGSGPQVIGVELNRSERAGTRSGCACGRRAPIATNRLSPKLLELVRRTRATPDSPGGLTSVTTTKRRDQIGILPRRISQGREAGRSVEQELVGTKLEEEL